MKEMKHNARGWNFLLVIFFSLFLLHPHQNQPGFYTRYHLFLHFGWFFQNREKDFIPTLLQKNVPLKDRYV